MSRNKAGVIFPAESADHFIELINVFEKSATKPSIILSNCGFKQVHTIYYI
jgi:hypothetical protein